MGTLSERDLLHGGRDTRLGVYKMADVLLVFFDLQLEYLNAIQTLLREHRQEV